MYVRKKPKKVYTNNNSNFLCMFVGKSAVYVKDENNV